MLLGPALSLGRNGKMLPKTGEKIPGGNDRDGRHASYPGIVAGALTAEMGATHQAAKIPMGWTDAGERIVKHWLAGAHGPGGGHPLVLMRKSEGIFRAVVTVCGRQQGVDITNVERAGPEVPPRGHVTW